MKCKILHQIKGRLRVLVIQPHEMTLHEADILETYLLNQPQVDKAKVNERNQTVTILYHGDEKEIFDMLSRFSYEEYDSEEIEDRGRELKREYEEKITIHILKQFIKRLFMPTSLRSALTIYRALPYLKEGGKSLWDGKVSVSTLDATSILISLLQQNFDTAGSVIFLLGFSDILEEWTHKKSVDDLARSMSIDVESVWLINKKKVEVLTPIKDVKVNDQIALRSGYMIPLDGVITSGEITVNQSSLTGESMPVHKKKGSLVYGGTVVEEGQCIIRITSTHGEGRFDRIIHMIEETEKLKSTVERRADLLAENLVPYSFLLTGLTYLFTQDVNRAVSVLMVDYSCALKLSIPIAVLSAIRECSDDRIVVKGGKYLELVSDVDTVVFDKTGTLTYSSPKVAKIIPLNGFEENETLRLAACLEEHYPHVVANAIVKEAKNRGLVHEEEHSKVEYIVAHGIKSSLRGTSLRLGSYHFIFEDEGYKLSKKEKEIIANVEDEYSSLYFVIGDKLAAIICIEEPERKEAKEVIEGLRELGIKKVVMMTGDSEKTARAIAKRLALDEYHAEVLPEDKANYVRKEKEAGRKVLMVGDGVNDTPALSEATIGIAIGDGAAIAREIADITISSDRLESLVTIRKTSTLLMNRINTNYRFIMGFNSLLILLGVFGILPASTSALLHNGSTAVISLASMTKL